jgi:hypothetical protein
MGNLFIADSHLNRVLKVTSDGVIHVIAGVGDAGFSGDGGPATLALLATPRKLALDAAENVYVAELANRVRKIAPNGVISTVAGNGVAGFSGDNGPAINASLNLPFAVAVDRSGNLFIADTGNTRIAKSRPTERLPRLPVTVWSDRLAMAAPRGKRPSATPSASPWMRLGTCTSPTPPTSASAR